MGPYDNHKAFLGLFKQAMEVWEWPDKQKMAHLLLLLTDKVQQLPADNRLEYPDLNCAILQ